MRFSWPSKQKSTSFNGIFTTVSFKDTTLNNLYAIANVVFATVSATFSIANTTSAIANTAFAIVSIPSKGVDFFKTVVLIKKPFPGGPLLLAQNIVT